MNIKKYVTTFPDSGAKRIYYTDTKGMIHGKTESYTRKGILYKISTQKHGFFDGLQYDKSLLCFYKMSNRFGQVKNCPPFINFNGFDKKYIEKILNINLTTPSL